MAILGYTRDEFGTKLGQVVFASHPVQTIQKLKGRENNLAEIEKALYAPGRHVFIYGDRGVGKSSLAATAAFQYQSADAEPIFVSGSVNDTFNTIIANIVYQALGRPRTLNVKTTKNVAFEWRGFKLGSGSEVTWTDIAAQIKSVSDAAELLREVGAIHSNKPVIVLDEFDTVKEAEERGKFASLLKQLGDKNVPLKFIFTGIGKSLDDLLGAHQSAHRQLLTHELPKLGWDGRQDIVRDAAAEFELALDPNVVWRIAAVSDGYPYYVHLITEHMLWAAFTDPDPVTEVSWPHFHEGLNAAIHSINAELRRPYESAVLHRSSEYEEIVWSTADDETLFRSLSEMFVSYKIILRKRNKPLEMERDRFNGFIRKLKQETYGALLQQESSRPGWYSYREKMLRGYVRMQAEANGVPLTGEREAPRQRMHVSSARHGYYAPSVPRGVATTITIENLGHMKDNDKLQ